MSNFFHADQFKTKQGAAFYVLVMVIGWLVPPLAVLVRFGIGIDFFLNIILTCMGYIPGHAHNFYLQNIRDNHGRGRSPKWAVKYGLIPPPDTSKHSWAKRYTEHEAVNQYDVEPDLSDESVNDFLDDEVDASASGFNTRNGGAKGKNSRAPIHNRRQASSNDYLDEFRSRRTVTGPADPLDDAQAIYFNSSSNAPTASAAHYAPQTRTFGDDLPGMGDRNIRASKGGLVNTAKGFISLKSNSSKSTPMVPSGQDRNRRPNYDDMDDLDRELQGLKPKSKSRTSTNSNANLHSSSAFYQQSSYDEYDVLDDFDRELQGRALQKSSYSSNSFRTASAKQPAYASSRPAVSQTTSSSSSSRRPVKPKDNFEDFWNHQF